MIHHISIGVQDPERVARVLAELWNGYALPFPVVAGGWMAMRGDANGTQIELIPKNLDMVPGAGEPAAGAPSGTGPQPWEVQYRRNTSQGTHGPVHAAVSSPLTEEEVYSIGRREGWRVLRCDRGPAFPVLELWIENVVLIEVLTPEMSERYVRFMTPRGFAELFGIPVPERMGQRAGAPRT